MKDMTGKKCVVTGANTGIGEATALELARAGAELANVLFTKALARRVAEGVTVHSLHPGVVASDVWRRVPWPFRSILKLFLISNADGAKTTLHCATSDECGRASGLYYDECRLKEPNPVVHDKVLQEELWARSAGWVGSQRSNTPRVDRSAPERERN